VRKQNKEKMYALEHQLSVVVASVCEINDKLKYTMRHQEALEERIFLLEKGVMIMLAKFNALLEHLNLQIYKKPAEEEKWIAKKGGKK